MPEKSGVDPHGLSPEKLVLAKTALTNIAIYNNGIDGFIDEPVMLALEIMNFDSCIEYYEAYLAAVKALNPNDSYFNTINSLFRKSY